MRQVGLSTPSCPASPRGPWHDWGAGELGLEALRARGLANVKAAFCRAAVIGRPFAARRPPSRRFALPLSDRRRLPSADRSNCRWEPAVGPLNFASWDILPINSPLVPSWHRFAIFSASHLVSMPFTSAFGSLPGSNACSLAGARGARACMRALAILRVGMETDVT